VDYDDADYANLGDELLYEVEMLYRLGEYMRERVVDSSLEVRSDRGLPARNALIESFAVHVRSLYAFFHDVRGRGKKKDAIVKDYLVHPHPAFDHAFRTRDRSLLNDRLAARVSRQVVHFSLGRPDSLAEKRDWEYDDICRAFKPLIEAMATDINPDRVSADFVERMQAAAASVPPAPTATVVTDTRASTESPSALLGSVPTQGLQPQGGGGTTIPRTTDHERPLGWVPPQDSGE
jgi:hypothetical protein